MILPMRKILLDKVALLIVVVFLTHLVATFFYLYWRFWWFDLLMHLLGGVWLGLFSAWFVFFSGYVSERVATRRNIVLASLLTVVVLGGGWEVFEYSLGVADSAAQSYSADVSTDFLMDTLGALIASSYMIGFLSKKKGV